MPRLLSIFDGTGSMSRIFEEAGWEIQSLDLIGTHGATLVTDIRKWDYSTEPAPDVLWAGCPCEQYSIARTRAKTCRNFELADSLVAKTWEIVQHFLNLNPNMLYFIENPASSLLWQRKVSEPFPTRIVLDYCSYGTLYRKRTKLATNSNYNPRPLCKPATCHACRNGKHIMSAQKGPSKGNDYNFDLCTLDQLHAYPPQLCQEICRYCSNQFWQLV